MKIIGDREILSVAEVNMLAKEVLESISIWVEGEIYDFKSADGRYYYIYFQLKDESGKMILPSIMLPATYNGLDFEFENGRTVMAHGKLTLFTKSGRYQFMADRVELAGQGKLALELERLKAALQKEGLFDENRKRALPDFCQRIGVITSTASDAWADFQRHSVEKFSLMKVTVADAFVQGPNAVPSILRALESMQELDLDVIVLTRGGGSLEDLSAFNDEQVVRAIAASRIPTLVAVGHEKDVSIADLVADVRASTPTNAGQLLTYPYERAASALQHYGQLLQRRAIEAVAGPGQELDQLMRHLLHIRHKYQSLPYQLAGLADKLEASRIGLMQTNISRLQQAATALSYQSSQRLGDISSRLHLAHRQLLAVSPLAVLERGYSVVEINGTIIRSVRQVKQGDTMTVRLHSGSLRGLVTRVEEPDA